MGDPASSGRTRSACPKSEMLSNCSSGCLTSLNIVSKSQRHSGCAIENSEISDIPLRIVLIERSHPHPSAKECPILQNPIEARLQRQPPGRHVVSERLDRRWTFEGLQTMVRLNERGV